MRARVAFLATLLSTSTLASAESFYLSPDVPTDLAGSTYLPWMIVRNDSGSYGPVLSLPYGTAIDGLHRMNGGDWLFSVDAPTELTAGSGTRYDPRDVVRFDGTSYTRFLDGAARGVPTGSDVDALFLNGGDTGDLILSFDVPTTIAGNSYDPADLVRVTAAGFSLFFDASAASPPIPASTDVTGADERNGLLVLTFDVPTTLGAVTYLPGQLVAWNPSVPGFTLLYSDPLWPSASRTNDFSFLAAPGRVPETIHVNKSAVVTGQLTLSWAAGCPVGAEDYGIYEGTIGSWYSHTAIDCADAAHDLAEDVTPSAGNRYYLVTPRNAAAEGSYGRRSNDAERPRGAPAACAGAQELESCL